MSGLDFIMGLLVGLGVFILQQYRFNKQLRKTLKPFSPQDDLTISLPLPSLIRRELSELDRIRQRLETDRQIWEELIEQAPIGYLQVDRDNQLLNCNQQGRILLKIEPHRSARIRLLLELVRSYELDHLIEQTRLTQQPQEKEWIFYSTRYVPPQPKENNSNPLSSFNKIVESIALKGYGFPLPDGRVGVFLIDRQPLIELTQSRDRAFSDLTHELRTPLTSISLVAENLLRRLQDPECSWVEKMLKETNRLIELVQEWLDLTELEASPHCLKYEEIELERLILSVWQTLEPIARQKQITLSYSETTTVRIQGDRARLIQVFLNLLDNAIKHNPPQQPVIVRVSLENDLAIIDVIDSGRGFAPADLPHIFERLYRGDKSRTRQNNDAIDYDGSGLGLAIVHQIVQAHQGSIEARNHSQQGGGWLQIVLPLDRL
jgi:two-component system, OmpR family, phosphate regulon sensor histidine kinase PhoR